MPNNVAHPIGAAWLVQTYKLSVVGQLPVISQVGPRRTSQVYADYTLETYAENMRPADHAAAHLHFHLRHEIPHLEFLARLFNIAGGDFIQAWVNAEPTGQYARRAAFLYEWLSGNTLQVPDRLKGNYVDALDAEKQLTASPEQQLKEPRWRVNDNMPGTRYFCPTVAKTEALQHAINLDIPQLIQHLNDEFGSELLQRASIWMTLRESKASFAIEGEGEQAKRIERFADVMARRTGRGDSVLNESALAQLQQEILGDRTTLTHFGPRLSPVFVGETIGYQDVVHYVAPPAEDLAAMLEGLRTFLERTQGQSPVMRAAIAAFAFVYIHPLADGNGRVHRFLVNDLLQRDDAVPAPLILPISAVMSDDVVERRAYDKVLDTISKPLMQHVRDDINFATSYTTYPDGVVSNLRFTANDEAQPVWRYPNLQPHIIFLSGVLHRTITEQMHEQSRHLRTHIRARQAVKEVVEMPDHQADRLLRSIEQNNGRLSNVLSKEMPILNRPEVWSAIVAAVNLAKQEERPADPNVIARYHPNRPAGGA